MVYPNASVVAARLHNLWARTTVGAVIKGVRIAKRDFNNVSGRKKIEEVFLKRVATHLLKKNLRILRFGLTFTVIDATTVDSWIEPTQELYAELLAPVAKVIRPQVLLRAPIKKLPAKAPPLKFIRRRAKRIA